MKHQIIRIAYILCFTIALVLPVSLTAEQITKHTLPAARTLTSTDGRTIEVVILAKTFTGIKAKRTDGKEFEIGLDKLSDADKAFVATLVEPPVKKLRMLVLDPGKQSVISTLKSYPFDLVILPRIQTPGFADESCDISAITRDEIAKYDIIWDGGVPITQRKQWREILKNYHGVVCVYQPSVTTKAQWLEDRKPEVFKNEPFIRPEKNFVFYNPYEITKAGEIVKTDDTIYKQVIEAALKPQN